MQASDLHVFTCRWNPMQWKRPDELYQEFAKHMLDSGVTLHVVECAYGNRPFTCQLPGVDFLGVRAKSRVWIKEGLLNLHIRRVPEAKYIAWIDADIHFRDPNWATKTLQALQTYDYVMPWSTALDLGPNDEVMTVHSSFAKVLHDGGPVSPGGPKFWKGDGGPYTYPHSGYAHSITRSAFNDVGGLLDIGAMGSSDFHMCQGLVGAANSTVPVGAAKSYHRHVMRWQERALKYINGNIGCVTGTIEHKFHGTKIRRDYLGRWNMFLRHQFCPDEDLKVNADGVYELAGNKPLLQRDFDRYLLNRNEDGTQL